MEPPKIPGEEIQMDFTGNLNSKHFDHSPFILVAVDSNSRWPVSKICKNTNHESVITFLQENTNIYGVTKSIKWIGEAHSYQRNLANIVMKTISSANTVQQTFTLARDWTRELSNP